MRSQNNITVAEVKGSFMLRCFCILGSKVDFQSACGAECRGNILLMLALAEQMQTCLCDTFEAKPPPFQPTTISPPILLLFRSLFLSVLPVQHFLLSASRRQPCSVLASSRRGNVIGMVERGQPRECVVDTYANRPPVPPRSNYRGARHAGVAQTMLFLLVSLALCGMVIEAYFILRLYKNTPVSICKAAA